MKWLRNILGGAVVLGIIAVASLSFSSASEWKNMEQSSIREAKTPANHQALAAARALEQKNRAGEHWAFIAKKYQEMAKGYGTLAEMHKKLAVQARGG